MQGGKGGELVPLMGRTSGRVGRSGRGWAVIGGADVGGGKHKAIVVVVVVAAMEV